MKLTKRTLLSLIALGLALTLLWRQPDRAEPVATETASYPSSYMVNAQIQQFDSNGVLSYQLTSQDLFFYEQSEKTKTDLVKMTQPSLIFFTQSNAPWHANSNNGLIENSGDLITLKENVTLKQKRLDETFTQLTTEELFIKPKEKYAENDKPVMIDDSSGQTESIGMKVNLETSIYELPKQVKSRYVP